MIIKSNFIFTKDKDEFTIEENKYITVEDGKIKEIKDDCDKEYINYSDKFMIPSFVNLHTHAPQFLNRGLGYDYELLPWLNKYTFVTESKYKDIEFARKYHEKFVDDLIRNGSLNSVIFGTIHRKSDNILIDLLKKRKVFSYVGKVNMTMNSPEYLVESKKESIDETIKFVEENKDERVKPIITPRFAISVDSDTLKKLSDIAIENNLPIQSHLDENLDEVKTVSELFEDDNYASVYYNRNLLGKTKTIMAHCIYMNDKEIKLMQNPNVFIAHCPRSNMNLKSGIAPIKKYLDLGINVGLGTDVSGGNNESMLEEIRASIQVSKLYSIYVDKNTKPIKTSEAFYMATKGGGKFFGKVGSFEKGYDFNALLIDDKNIVFDRNIDLLDRINAFIYSADDRNIVKRFVLGEEIY